MLTDLQRESIVTALDKHVRDEDVVLGRYRELAGIFKDGPAGLLIRLIFMDEERHHALLARLAEDLRGAVDTGSMAELGEQTPADAPTLIGNLAKHEEVTIDECRKLKARVTGEGLQYFNAIMDAVIADSEKHQKLLLALQQMIVRARSS